MTLIKICGVTDPEVAIYAAEWGADMIGIIQCPGSKRHVSLSQAIEIAMAARCSGAIPVAVFKDLPHSAILAACAPMGVEVIQLHGIEPRGLDKFTLIMANSEASSIDPSRDYLLYDNDKPGTGIPFDWTAFQPPLGVRWFLSGGLTSENVEEGMRLFHPTGVDVSSGVEENGLKNKDLIKKFIDKVRSYG